MTSPLASEVRSQTPSAEKSRFSMVAVCLRDEADNNLNAGSCGASCSVTSSENKMHILSLAGRSSHLKTILQFNTSSRHS
jgi:hypothetical protein